MNTNRYALKVLTMKVREESPLPQTFIQRPEHAIQYLRPYFIEERDDRERIVALCLSAKHRVLGIAKISEGASTMAVVDPRVLYRILICSGACAYVLCHNHPSGDAHPSPEDFALTKRLRESGELLNLQCLDHIILGDGTETFYSFVDHDQFPPLKRTPDV